MVPGDVGTLYSRIHDGDRVVEDMLPDVSISSDILWHTLRAPLTAMELLFHLKNRYGQRYLTREQVISVT